MVVALALGGAPGAASADKRLPECPEPPHYRASWGKEDARTAEITAETYSTDHNGYYTGLTRRKLHRYEPSLALTPREVRHEGDGAYLSRARAISHGRGYIVRTRSLDGERFAIMREADGEIQRTGWVHGQHCAF